MSNTRVRLLWDVLKLQQQKLKGAETDDERDAVARRMEHAKRLLADAQARLDQ